MGKSMNGQLSMFDQMTCEGSRSVIGSPGLVAGVTRCDSPDGLITNQSGPAPALVSRSRQQARAEGRKTRVTFGRSSAVSFASADLQRSLASRLRARLAASGSPVYSLTWKHWPIAQQEPICALRASARKRKSKSSMNLRETWSIRGAVWLVHRTSDSDCSGWPTPVANDDNKTPEAHLAMKARMGGGRKEITSLQVMAKTFAGWPTATVHDAERGGQAKRAMGETRHGSNLQDFALLTGWKTPTVNDSKGSDYTYSQGNHDRPCLKLSGEAKLTGWPTPTVGNATGSQRGKDASLTGRRPDGSKATVSLNAVAGATLNGSHVETANTGQLNPAFSRWLQGYPAAWCQAAIRAHRNRTPRRKRALVVSEATETR